MLVVCSVLCACGGVLLANAYPSAAMGAVAQVTVFLAMAAWACLLLVKALRLYRPEPADGTESTAGPGLRSAPPLAPEAVGANGDWDQAFQRWADAFPVMIRRTSADGAFVFFNSSWCEATARTEAELAAGSWLTLTPEGESPSNFEGLRDRVRRGTPFSHDFSLRLLDGTVARLRESFAVCTDQHGVQHGMMGICQDISTQHIWQEALRQREQELSEVFEKALTGVHVIDPSGIICDANPAELRLLGYAADEFIGHHIREFHAEPEAAEGFISRVNRGETIANLEIKLLARDLSVRTVLLSASPQTEKGSIQLIRCFTHDITERRSVESKFREHTQRFESLAAMAPVGIFHTDDKGRCLYVNDRWCRLAGATLQTALGDGWGDFVHPEDKERVIRSWSAAVEKGKEFRAEFRFQTPAGIVSTLLSAAVPVRDGFGRLSGYVGTVTDITEMKQSRDDLYRSLQTQLEVLDREKTLRRELDHRVRNNLASLIGLVRIYEREGRTDLEVLSTIEGKIVAMKDVHETISRGDGHNVELLPLLSQLSRSLIPAEYEIRVSRSGPAVTLSASEGSALAMIFQELVINSLKHGALASSDGRISVTWSIQNAGEQTLLILDWNEKGRAEGATIADGGSGVGLPLIAGFARTDLRGAATFHDTSGEWRCHLLAELSVPQPAPPVTIAGVSGAEG